MKATNNYFQTLITLSDTPPRHTRPQALYTPQLKRAKKETVPLSYFLLTAHTFSAVSTFIYILHRIHGSSILSYTQKYAIYLSVLQTGVRPGFPDLEIQSCFPSSTPHSHRGKP